MGAPFSPADQSEETVVVRWPDFSSPVPTRQDLVLHAQAARRLNVPPGVQDPFNDGALAALRKIAAFASRPDYTSTYTATLCISIARDALRQAGELPTTPVRHATEELFVSPAGA